MAWTHALLQQLQSADWTLTNRKTIERRIVGSSLLIVRRVQYQSHLVSSFVVFVALVDLYIYVVCTGFYTIYCR